MSTPELSCQIAVNTKITQTVNTLARIPQLPNSSLPKLAPKTKAIGIFTAAKQIIGNKWRLAAGMVKSTTI